MTTKFLDTDGRVIDYEIAEEMAYIEKPFRENKLGIIKSIFIWRASEILKWQEKSGEFLNKKIEFEKELEEKLRLAEELRIAEERKAEEDRIKRDKETERLIKEKEEFELRNPQELKKLDIYIKYLQTQPELWEAINFLYDFANKANAERSDDSYIIYRKARRALYQNFYNRIDASDNMREILMIPTDWRTTEDDELFLFMLSEKDRKNENSFYRSKRCISIYRVWNIFNSYLEKCMMNKSLASAMIIKYCDDSWYNLKEYWTKVFIEATLRKNGEKWLLDCMPTDNLRANNHFMKYFWDEINEFEREQKSQYNMNKEEYKIFLENEEKERLQEIAEQYRIKKEAEEKMEQERKRKEAEEQARKEQERLQKIERDELRQSLLNI
ncbi:MAG: hypothetical protein ACD_49C00079G0007 [uncultured bacterium (gcode 4)]|uniref:Uncharacterized protein n=1 Tax=uncultured bacterium (gcode 4) TaxID=1234023 RepID=K2BAR7_9BACT|nr:MAG: hypothetical protein ACD_49C00079G0007 [uncultured bacterium (gcode 4)]